MINYENIGLMFDAELLSQKSTFSEEQIIILQNIIDKISSLNTEKNSFKVIKTIKKYKSFESDFIIKFRVFGGDMEKLNKRLRAYENNSIPYMNEFSKSIKNIKNRLKVK